VVIVNPEAAHACRPLDAACWSYRMLYVDAGWLAGLQRELGFSANADFRAFSVTLASRRDLFDGLVALCSQLADADSPALARQDAAVAFFAGLQQALDPAPRPLPAPSRRVERAADYIREHFARPVRLEEICAAADLSATHLIRSFKACYGMPPHAFLVNRRVEHSRMLLRRGLPIADVAAAAGFADQAHLQRIFRRLVATTPGRYRMPSQRPA
jgi:AraC-like DNA-binding protein